MYIDSTFMLRACQQLPAQYSNLSWYVEGGSTANSNSRILLHWEGKDYFLFNEEALKYLDKNNPYDVTQKMVRAIKIGGSIQDMAMNNDMIEKKATMEGQQVAQFLLALSPQAANIPSGTLWWFGTKAGKALGYEDIGSNDAFKFGLMNELQSYQQANGIKHQIAAKIINEE